MCGYAKRTDFKLKCLGHCPGLQDFSKNPESRLPVFNSEVALSIRLIFMSIPTFPHPCLPSNKPTKKVTSVIENIKQARTTVFEPQHYVVSIIKEICLFLNLMGMVRHPWI